MIVNVVNIILCGGGGVDGVIYWVVGLGLDVVCVKFGGCLIGEVWIMLGFNLLVIFIIYILGLVW